MFSLLLSVKYVLFFCRSAYGASICARTAGYAFVSVDNILAVAFGNAAGGASILASAARNAFVRNLVCHSGNTSIFFGVKYILSYFPKKSRGFL